MTASAESISEWAPAKHQAERAERVRIKKLRLPAIGRIRPPALTPTCDPLLTYHNFQRLAVEAELLSWFGHPAVDADFGHLRCGWIVGRAEEEPVEGTPT